MGLGEVLSLLVEFSHCEMDQLINCIDGTTVQISFELMKLAPPRSCHVINPPPPPPFGTSGSGQWSSAII